MKYPTLQKLICGTLRALRRFWLTLFCALLYCWTWTLVPKAWDLHFGGTTHLILLACYICMLLTLLVSLMGERLGLKPLSMLGLQVLALGLGWVYYAEACMTEPRLVPHQFLIWVVVLHLLILWLPYWGIEGFRGLIRYMGKVVLRFLLILSICFVPFWVLVYYKVENVVLILLIMFFNTWIFLGWFPEIPAKPWSLREKPDN